MGELTAVNERGNRVISFLFFFSTFSFTRKQARPAGPTAGFLVRSRLVVVKEPASAQAAPDLNRFFQYIL